MMKRHTSDAIGTSAKRALVAAALVAASAYAAAQTAAAPAAVARSSADIGEATRCWLELQRSNAAAAPPLPVLGEEAGLAYARYLDSFKTKIPSAFDSTLGAGSSALSTGYPALGGAKPAGAN